MRRKENAECRMTSSTASGPPSPTGKALGEGYAEGYRKGVRDMAKRLKRYYKSFNSKTMSAAVEYTVGLVADELIEKENDYGGNEEKG